MNITLDLPGEASLPYPSCERSAQNAFMQVIEETRSGLQHVVTIADLPNGSTWRGTRSVNSHGFPQPGRPSLARPRHR